MVRKRRRPTPSFGIPPPYNPIVGGHADLRTEGIHPYCAMMQVAAEDEYDDYVICRGFDPRTLKFVDYEEGNDDKPGISVAKPFGNRVKGYYQIGQIYPAFLPTQGTVSGVQGGTNAYVPPSPTDVDWRVGQNPGTTSGLHYGGHPEELDETITVLTDHNNKYVNWMLVDNGFARGAMWKAKANETIEAGTVFADEKKASLYGWDGSDTEDDVDVEFDWCANGQDDISEGDELLLWQVGDKYYIIGRECP